MSLRSTSVLVADDEPQLLRVVVRVLERRGYPVVQAASGEEALKAFRAAPDAINVVVLDAAIGPDGSEPVLADIVRERPGIGVVVTSGDVLPDSLRKLMLQHDGIFLRKPFPPEALLSAVEDSQIKDER